MPRWAMMILLLGAGPGWSEIRDVVKSAEVDRLFASAAPSFPALTKNNYAIVFRAVTGAQAADPRDHRGREHR